MGFSLCYQSTWGVYTSCGKRLPANVSQFPAFGQLFPMLRAAAVTACQIHVTASKSPLVTSKRPITLLSSKQKSQQRGQDLTEFSVHGERTTLPYICPMEQLQLELNSQIQMPCAYTVPHLYQPSEKSTRYSMRQSQSIWTDSSFHYRASPSTSSSKRVLCGAECLKVLSLRAQLTVTRKIQNAQDISDDLLGLLCNKMLTS